MDLKPHVVIGQRTVDADSDPYVIAEIGVNHEGSLERAFELIDLAHAGGADAAKFQSYKAGTLASRHSPSYWDTNKEPTRSQYQLFQKYDCFDAADYERLAAHCRTRGIDFLSTPFDRDAVEFLSPLVSVFKIASADVTNVPLLRQVAGKGKPVLLSAGASTLSEVDAAVATLTTAGCSDIVLLHCILNYPTDYANANLDMIGGLARAYPGRLIGYSDHTVPDAGMLVLLTAWQRGAVILEKHFTYDKTLPGNDHYHAMDVDDLRMFRKQVAFIRPLGGRSAKAPLESEGIARLNARRSIVVQEAIAAGTVIEERMLTCKRPGTGVSPEHWDSVIGRVAARALEPDHLLRWEDLQSS